MRLPTTTSDNQLGLFAQPQPQAQPGLSLEKTARHPMLEAVYADGLPLDPAALGGHVARTRIVKRARAFFSVLARLLFGKKSFCEPTNVGFDLGAFGAKVPFRWRFGFSRLDGRPATLLRYGDASLHNGWPIRKLTGELRMIAPRAALGVLLRSRAGAAPKPICWYALEW